MKKILAFMLITSLLFGAAGCSSETTEAPSNSSSGSIALKSETQTDVESGVLGKYSIEIKDAFITTDFEGEPALIVNYNFTNNNTSAESFLFSVHDAAFQDGKELGSAVVLKKEIYAPETATTNVAPGETLSVQRAFLLINRTSPIQIDVVEFLSTNPVKVTKTFDISTLTES